jgi:hypothetical protein
MSLVLTLIICAALVFPHLQTFGVISNTGKRSIIGIGIHNSIVTHAHSWK